MGKCTKSAHKWQNCDVGELLVLPMGKDQPMVCCLRVPRTLFYCTYKLKEIIKHIRISFRTLSLKIEVYANIVFTASSWTLHRQVKQSRSIHLYLLRELCCTSHSVRWPAKNRKTVNLGHQGGRGFHYAVVRWSWHHRWGAFSVEM